MPILRDLTAREKASVLRAAELCLTQLQARGDSCELRDAIVDGLDRRGWKNLGVDGARERSITAIFAEVVDLGWGNDDAHLDPIQAVENWAETKTIERLCEGIRQVIRYLEEQK